jgi:hypothetical protein
MLPDSTRPEQPPPIHPRIRMRRGELIGMCVIALIPVLAVVGVFGPELGHARHTSGALQLDVRYPSLTRHQLRETLEARVANLSGETLPHITLTFDPSYIIGFSSVSFVPPADRAYAVELRDLQPRESRLVTVELEAERYGWHRGQVAASDGTGHVLAAMISTLTFP